MYHTHTHKWWIAGMTDREKEGKEGYGWMDGGFVSKDACYQA